MSTIPYVPAQLESGILNLESLLSEREHSHILRKTMCAFLKTDDDNLLAARSKLFYPAREKAERAVVRVNFLSYDKQSHTDITE